jgi:hypothetical protein
MLLRYVHRGMHTERELEAYIHLNFFVYKLHFSMASRHQYIHETSRAARLRDHNRAALPPAPELARDRRRTETPSTSEMETPWMLNA